MRLLHALSVLLPLAVALGGCAQPAPKVTLEPRIELGDLVPGLPPADNGYRLLDDQRTQGRFACALALAKFETVEDEQGVRLALTSLRANEQAHWLDQLRGFIALRELVFLWPLNTVPAQPTVAATLTAARQLDARLLLVYAPNGFGANAAQVLGVLYDVNSGRPLATLQASAALRNAEGVEASPDEEPGDRRDEDARFQAHRSFERFVLACLANLIERDTPVTTQPSPAWLVPYHERWWIPIWSLSR